MTFEQRLLPEETSARQGVATAEFLVLQARLEAESQDPETPEGEVEEE